MTKDQWLEKAEIFDALRIIPRAMLFGYSWFVLYAFHEILTWYQGLPAAERTIEASGLAGALITAITGLGSMFLSAYLKSGRDWEADE